MGISFQRERLRFALEGAGLTMSCPWPVISRLAELRKELGHPSGRLILAVKAVLIGRPGAVLEGDLTRARTVLLEVILMTTDPAVAMRAQERLNVIR